MADDFVISKKPLGEDSTKVFSIRLDIDLVEKLDGLAMETNYSRNELISRLLRYGLEHTKVIK